MPTASGSAYTHTYAMLGAAGILLTLAMVVSIYGLYGYRHSRLRAPSRSRVSQITRSCT